MAPDLLRAYDVLAPLLVTVHVMLLRFVPGEDCCALAGRYGVGVGTDKLHDPSTLRGHVS